MIDKQKIDSEVMDLLQFNAKVLGLDMSKMDKNQRKLAVRILAEAIKEVEEEK